MSHLIAVLASCLLLLAPLTRAEGPLFPPGVRATADGLMAAALDDALALELVTSLSTEIGPRLAGTAQEARARDWAVDQLKKLGFSNVRVEPFAVPLWVRGDERAEILEPFPQPLAVTALGGSTATDPEGVAGDVVAFSSLAALEAAPDGSLAGRIVFVDEPMTRTQDGSGYGVAVGKRRATAYEAERLGAVGALIRSVGTDSHRFPHTGQMRRLTEDGGAGGVPTAALSAPDADQLRRVLARADQVSVRLVLTPQLLPPSRSGNVVAEIPGREAPEEVVLAGAHLDAWDLGTGAVDDGAGVAIVVAAARLLKALPEPPRRTVRVVLFGAEEVGLVGAKAYAEQHAAELEQHVIAAESDFGAGRIWRFDTAVGQSALPTTAAIRAVLHPLGIGPGSNSARGGPDLTYLREAGVPVVGLIQNGWDYFDLHHTPDDTLDKIEPAALAQNVAAYAAFLYLAAEVETDFRK
ncbi:M20/M25/M40 family metallo-hydrolase [Pseudohaliea rubra]|uniref:Carboxypeptidase Q n=1 Tax=Pseudohaliea rubra DSM 19751 TaxID=1265313 RepID=A0A095X1F7_9GAMM|nr:M20/M25/M40 family metallo-hydrolase [Pseudohaliea rubra]KGE04694.1 Aminopeptidase [Pseudohaliea rubra DSM 19751]